MDEFDLELSHFHSLKLGKVDTKPCWATYFPETSVLAEIDTSQEYRRRCVCNKPHEICPVMVDEPVVGLACFVNMSAFAVVVGHVSSLMDEGMVVLKERLEMSEMNGFDLHNHEDYDQNLVSGRMRVGGGVSLAAT